MTLDPDGPVGYAPGKFKPTADLTRDEVLQARTLFRRKRELVAEAAALWTRLLEWHQQAELPTDTSTYREIQDVLHPLKALVKDVGA